MSKKKSNVRRDEKLFKNDNHKKSRKRVTRIVTGIIVVILMAEIGTILYLSRDKISDYWSHEANESEGHSATDIEAAGSERYSIVNDEAVESGSTEPEVNEEVRTVRTDPATGNSYELFLENLTWEDAKLYCEERGGHLVVIESEAEQEFIEQLLKEFNDGRDLWMGATGNTNKWSWINNARMNYWHFSDGEPNGSGTVMQMFGDGYWDDTNPDGYNGESYIVHGFICEYE